MGEGLKADEARDAAFLLTGARAWVGKLAYLTANPMTLQEGKRAIVHAMSDHGVKARGLGHPRVDPTASSRLQPQQEEERPKTTIPQISIPFARPRLQE